MFRRRDLTLEVVHAVAKMRMAGHANDVDVADTKCTQFVVWSNLYPSVHVDTLQDGASSSNSDSI